MLFILSYETFFAGYAARCVYVFFFLLDFCFVFFKQKTAYEMRISDWSSDVCSSDLPDSIVLLEVFSGKVFHRPLFLQFFLLFWRHSWPNDCLEVDRKSVV